MADPRVPFAWQPGSPILADALLPTTKQQDIHRLYTYVGKLDRNAHRSKVVDALLDTWPAQMAKSAWGAFTLPGDVYAGKVDPLSDEAVQRSADLAGMVTLGAGAIPAEANSARMGIKAYHGTPHDFDKFELSDKTIGTGEGAQAYGHGLYFAENSAAAQWYRDQLSQNVVDIKKVADPYLPLPDDEALRKLRVAIKNAEFNGRNSDAKIYKNAAAWIEAGRPDEFSPGRVYEVDLNASPDDFLDWDKPLSEQPKAVQDAIKSTETYKHYLAGNEAGRMQHPDTYPGSRWISFLQDEAARVDEAMSAPLPSALPDSRASWRSSSTSGPNVASEILRGKGIKGIRYKDAGSRATEGGTSNYVVFDDSIIDIIKKYGIAGLIAAGVGTSALTAQPGTAEARE